MSSFRFYKSAFLSKEWECNLFLWCNKWTVDRLYIWIAQYLELLLDRRALWNLTQGVTPQNVDFLWLRCLVRGVYILADFARTCTWPCPLFTYYFGGADHSKNGTMFDGVTSVKTIFKARPGNWSLHIKIWISMTCVFPVHGYGDLVKL